MQRTASAKGRANAFDKFVCNAFSKIARTVAEARLLAPGVRENKDKDENFLIHTRVVSEVDEDLPDLVRTRDGAPTNLLVFTISIDTHAELAPPGGCVSCRMQPGIAPSSGLGQQPSPRGERGWDADANRYRVLERWILQRQVHESDTGSVSTSSAVVKQLLLLVRAVHSCLRLLPCHKTAVQLQSRNASMGLKYRLSTSLAPPSNESSFGSHADPLHEYSFGEVDTPSGRICVKVQYSVSNSEDYTVAATEFATQGLQRREQRSISLPTEVPDLQALLAPDSPLGIAAAKAAIGQTRHYSPQGFPLQQSTGMGAGMGGGAISGVYGGTVGRPPRAPNRAGMLRGEHQGSSPRLSGSPSSGSASLDRGTPPDYSSSPRSSMQELMALTPLTLPAQATPSVPLRLGGMGAMAEHYALGHAAWQGGLGFGVGGGGGAMVVRTSGDSIHGGGSGRLIGASESMVLVGEQQTSAKQQSSTTAFVDHLRQQQLAYASPLSQHAGRASSSPGVGLFGGGGIFPGSSPGSAGFLFGTSPGDGTFGGTVGGSPSSPSQATWMLMQSFNTPLNDPSPWNTNIQPDWLGSREHVSGEAMQRVVTLSKRQQQQQQQQQLKQQQHTQGNTGHSCSARSDAPWADSLEEGGLDWGAPFALSSGVEEGAHDSRSLETLMRILEKREPSFLLEDDGVVGGGRGGRRDVGCGGVEGLFDSDLDCLLSMPAASDLTVGDVIWDMQQMQEIIETKIQPILDAVNSKP